MTRRIDRWAAEHCEDIVSVSGGKDSTAAYLLAIEQGRPFRAVFADTGNEHEWTYDYVRDLPRLTGGPEITWVRPDFTDWFEHRRRYIAEHWPAEGIDQAVVDQAVALLRPTGNPYLDLCMLKGRFPSRRAQFCTEFLKTMPIAEQVLIPASQHARDRGRWVRSWVAVRADESARRQGYDFYQWEDFDVLAYRPILRWEVGKIWDIHRRHGLRPNPLYFTGMGRVGCMPCINVRKQELQQIARQFPEHIDRIAEWERIVVLVSKRGAATYLPAPEKKAALRDCRNIHDHVAWAKTSRGGQQFDLDSFLPPAPCSSVYGLCESRWEPLPVKEAAE